MFKRTKIIATIGPASANPETLEKLITSGMDAARLNFSHGSHEEKETLIYNLRKLSAKLATPVAIIADLQGPKLRLGKFEGTRDIAKGEEISLSIIPDEVDLPIDFDISPFVKPKQRIYLNDGLVELRITKVKGKVVYSKAINSGWVSSRKGINIPDAVLGKATFTEKDIKDALFAIKHKVDFIAISFVETAEDILVIREIIQKHNSNIKIIAKVETNESIANIESIADTADVVMVARGDLAIETTAAEVPVLQQKIIRLCRQFQTPVVIATHMLESMIKHPRSTRAEASDVANAVLSQVDAVMLSGETAIGSFPVEAVRQMHDIIMTVEKASEFKRYIKLNWESIKLEELHTNAITASAASLSYRIKAPVIAVATASGRTALLMSSFRPDARIVAATHKGTVANQLKLVWGVMPQVVAPTKTSEEFWRKMSSCLLTKGYARKGQMVVMTGGSSVVGQSGSTDTIKVALI